MYRFRRRRRSVAHMSDIMLTPLIDVVLTLLIIFIVTTPIINNSIKVDLPEGSANQVESTIREIIVSIDEKGGIYCNGVCFNTLDELVRDVKKKLGKNSKQTVFVRGDKLVIYDKVMVVVQAMLKGGISGVAMETQRTT